jgi:NDP-sugar pyrophosphorylase family protein
MGMIPALIVAGGRGVRMGAATADLPKPMLPLAGKPILEHQLERLKAAGYREAHLCLGFKAQAVKDYFGDGSRWGMSLHYHVEDAPRGTAGCVADLRARLGEDLLVVYGDLLLDMDLGRFLAWHAERPAAAASLVLIHSDHPLDSDLARLDGERLAGFYRARAGEPHGDLALAAVWAVRGPALDLVPADKPADFGRDVFPEALRRGLDLRAYVTDETLADLGTPERFARAERAMRAA